MFEKQSVISRDRLDRGNCSGHGGVAPAPVCNGSCRYSARHIQPIQPRV